MPTSDLLPAALDAANCPCFIELPCTQLPAGYLQPLSRARGLHSATEAATFGHGVASGVPRLSRAQFGVCLALVAMSSVRSRKGKAKKDKYGDPRGRTQGKQTGRSDETQRPGRILISGGCKRNHYLDVPGVFLRPMMGRVREDLFNMLSYTPLMEKESASVLDLFAGSGIVGLEALSHMMPDSTACFVDFSSECTAAIRKNCENLGFTDRTRVVRARAEDALNSPKGVLGKPEPFDLITLTPPYEEINWDKLFHALTNSPALKQDTLVVIEYPSEIGMLTATLGGGRLVGIRNRQYGRTYLALYVNEPSGREDMLRPRAKEFSKEPEMALPGGAGDAAADDATGSRDLVDAGYARLAPMAEPKARRSREAGVTNPSDDASLSF